MRTGDGEEDKWLRLGYFDSKRPDRRGRLSKGWEGATAEVGGRPGDSGGLEAKGRERAAASTADGPSELRAELSTGFYSGKAMNKLGGRQSLIKVS